MNKPQATPLGIASWILAIPLLYYVSIFPVVIGLRLCFEEPWHAPEPLMMTVMKIYAPWSAAAEAIPALGLPLDFVENLPL